MHDAVLVFIAPPSLEALRARLVGRGTDDPEEVGRRLRVAEQELGARDEFGHVVVNDRLEDALEQLSAIVLAELDRPPAAGGGEATTLGGSQGKART
jgi:guanylate kinase